MKVLDANAIEQAAVTWRPLIEAAGTALIALARDVGHVPLRTSLPLAGGQLLTMPGRLPDSPYAVVKLVTVVPANAARGLPTIQGTVLAFDAETGAAIAQLDGPTLTAVRTAAISGAAVRTLAPDNADVLALIGAGVQAPWQARAIASLLPLRQVRIWSPSCRNRERLASLLDEELDVMVRPVNTLEDAALGAGIICCSTTAPRPFLEARLLNERPVLIVAIGAYRPDMGEVAPSVFREAGGVYVDDKHAVLHEGGDVIDAVASGVITEDAVVPVGEVISGRTRPEAAVRIFKSVGSALEDAAITGALLER